MENELLEELRIKNKIEEYDNKVKIYLNKPQNFIYDIQNIIVEYSFSNHSASIIGNEIPDTIKNNINKYSNRPICDFVKIIEENINIFLSGNIPSIPISAPAKLRPFELPKHHKFYFNNHITKTNLKYEAVKIGVFIFICSSIQLSVKCRRCSNITVTGSSKECPNCGEELNVKYIPMFEDNFLGFLELSKCSFVCVEPSIYQFNCSECHNNYETNALSIGTTFSHKCYICFSVLHIKILQIQFIENNQYQLKIGNPLPDNGTCEHYKKSFRWFRFPCCKTLYPCDICHDEKSGHKGDLAKTMVCGLCSKEQSVNNQCNCGMSLKQKSSKYWEGGKGNRDKSTMSRKDSKKYSK